MYTYDAFIQCRCYYCLIVSLKYCERVLEFILFIIEHLRVVIIEHLKVGPSPSGIQRDPTGGAIGSQGRNP